VREAVAAAENGKTYVTEEEGGNFANYMEGNNINVAEISTIGADSPAAKRVL